MNRMRHSWGYVVCSLILATSVSVSMADLTNPELIDSDYVFTIPRGDGGTERGFLLQDNGNTLVLRTSTGRKFTVSIDILSDADRKHVEFRRSHKTKREVLEQKKREEESHNEALRREGLRQTIQWDRDEQNRRLAEERKRQERALAAAQAEWEVQQQSHGLGRTQEQILSDLESTFPDLEDTPPCDDRPRRWGQSPDGLAAIEIIGEPRDVYSAGVIVSVHNPNWFDDGDLASIALMRNLGVCQILIHNTLPNWLGGAEWFTAALERILDSPEKWQEEAKIGDATITLMIIKELAMCAVSIGSNK